jgi:hypothetical protein
MPWAIPFLSLWLVMHMALLASKTMGASAFDEGGTWLTTATEVLG